MLDQLISAKSLRTLAGSAAFQRGEEYLAAGAVGPLQPEQDRLSARVSGTKTYAARLWVKHGKLAGDCTCPRAGDGFFCKHCVALGLAWIRDCGSAPPSVEDAGPKPARPKRHDPWKSIRQYLETQPSASLIDMLLEAARRDDRIFRSLLLKAERTKGTSDLGRALRRAIDGAVRINGAVGWGEEVVCAADIDEIVDDLAELLRPDAAALLIELTEYAIERLEAALGAVDDSNGELGDVILRLGQLHLQACTLAQPDPAALAERLFRLEASLPVGLWSFDPATYRIPFGEAGLQSCERLVEAEWQNLKPLAKPAGYDPRRSFILRRMERLAEARGDVDKLLAIKAKALTSTHSYLDIAEILAKAGRHDEALDWAERGLKAFPVRPGAELLDFLVAAYLERKRNDEALQLTWIQFEECPDLGPYKKLKEVAGKLGIWPAQRERALAWLEREITRLAASTSTWKSQPSTPNCSLRLSIALWEQDLDAAWAATRQGVCDHRLLIKLAEQLEADRTDDAISLYQRVIPAVVGEARNAAYEQGVQLVRTVGRLMQAQNRLHAFGDYLARLRLQFKPKRNFMTLLDGVDRDFGPWN